MKARTITAAIAATLVPATTALAAPPSPDAAMRKGIRDYAHSIHATASHIAVRCAEAPEVDDRAACSGSFRLAKASRATTYSLTHGARVLRISPNALEYRVEARTAQRVPGLPRTTGAFGGFLQGG